MTTSHPPTAGLPNTPVTERPNVAKVVAAGCVGIFVELYDNGDLRLHGHRAGHRVLRRDQPEQRAAARLRRVRHLFLRPPARRCRLRYPRRPDRSPARAGARYRRDQRRHRGHRYPAHVRGHRHRRAHPAGHAARRAGLLGRRRGRVRDDLPRRTRTRRAPRPDHQLRPDRVVRGPAHRHPGRLRHVAVAERGRDRRRRLGKLRLAHPVPRRHPDGRHRLLHPQANRGHPELHAGSRSPAGCRTTRCARPSPPPSTAARCCSPCSSR